MLKFGAFFILFVGLQFVPLQAAQEFQKLGNNKESVIPVRMPSFIISKELIYNPTNIQKYQKAQEKNKKLTDLVPFEAFKEGFEILEKADDSFDKFLQEKKLKEGPQFNFYTALMEARHIISQSMQWDFLIVLCQAIQAYGVDEIDQIKHPVFEYVMKYRKSFMQPFLQKWVNFKDKKGNTPLSLAAIKNKSSIVTMLIEAGVDVNAQNNYGDTPLHKAIVHHHNEIAEKLMMQSARVNVQNNHKRTPLHLAILCNNQPIATMLIKNYKVNLNIQDSLGITPLYLAVLHGNIDVIQSLLQQGASPNIQGPDGNTPLHEAVIMNAIDMVGVLIHYNALLKVHNDYGKTAQELIETPEMGTLFEML